MTFDKCTERSLCMRTSAKGVNEYPWHLALFFFFTCCFIFRMLKWGKLYSNTYLFLSARFILQKTCSWSLFVLHRPLRRVLGLGADWLFVAWSELLGIVVLALTDCLFHDLSCLALWPWHKEKKVVDRENANLEPSTLLNTWPIAVCWKWIQELPNLTASTLLLTLLAGCCNVSWPGSCALPETPSTSPRFFRSAWD